jgi:addiction module HigA family antidote
MARLRTHPGEVLREEYLVPPGLSARALARELDVPPNRLTEIIESEGVIEHQALDLAVGGPTPMRAGEIELRKTVKV